jgi:hypothetical protein
MKWNNEDVELVEKFIEIRNKGYYCDGAQLTAVYNRVLQKNVNVTNCGSCLRQRVNELADALDRFKRQIALEEEQKKQEEKPVEETKKPKAKK